MITKSVGLPQDIYQELTDLLPVAAKIEDIRKIERPEMISKLIKTYKQVKGIK